MALEDPPLNEITTAENGYFPRVWMGWFQEVKSSVDTLSAGGVGGGGSGAVDSVNTKTGVVVLGTDDLVEGDNKFVTSANIAKLNGIEISADVTDAANVAAAGALLKGNNLSDLLDAGAARDNLAIPLVDNTFEITSKNLNSYPFALNYTSDVLTSIVYTVGSGTITKTFGYTSESLTSVVLSGDTPSGIDLTKTLNYTGSELTSVTYT